MAVELTREELDELYEVLGGAQNFLKHYERMGAALNLDDKPAKYSPLTRRLMAVRNSVGEKVAIVHATEQQQQG
jgi:hypothetical protein